MLFKRGFLGKNIIETKGWLRKAEKGRLVEKGVVQIFFGGFITFRQNTVLKNLGG